MNENFRTMAGGLLIGLILGALVSIDHHVKQAGRHLADIAHNMPLKVDFD